MTDQETPKGDSRFDPERKRERSETDEAAGTKDKSSQKDVWTREGPDAPDAADIAEPDKQR